MTDIDRLRTAIRSNLQEQKNLRARIRNARRSYKGTYEGPEWDAYCRKVWALEATLADYKSCLRTDKERLASLTSLPC